MTLTRPIRKLLIANRGEIAVRVMRTARDLGIKTVAVYSEADRDSLFASLADEAIFIGAAAAADSYLNIQRIVDAAKITGADAVHPGYGFLSENPDFADALKAEDIQFLGPSAEAMRAMALKGAAKALMIDAGVPVVPGYHGDDQSNERLRTEALAIGLPVLFKAVAGGGGKGMRIAHTEADILPAIEAARREGQNSFANPALLVEKYLEKPRHIEIQVFGDHHGHVVHLWERDCSLQRRHQKVVEEAPAPGMSPAMRSAMGSAAVRAAEAIGYAGAGTVEFIVDVANGLDGAPFYFMEMNTRLQVEHPVTELITGQDLVAWQIRVVEGLALPMSQEDINAACNGHSVEVRLYAEDPARDFAPQTGKLERFDHETAAALVPNLRIDTGIRSSDDRVTVHYDPMIAKIMAWGDDRLAAIQTLLNGLQTMPIVGLKTNRDFLIQALQHPAFKAGDVDTGFIERFSKWLLATIPPHPADLAMAAALILDESANAEPANPWSRSSAFRLNLPAQDRLTLAWGEETYDLLVEHRDGLLIVRIEDDSIPVRPLPRTDVHSRFEVDGCQEWGRLIESAAGHVTLLTPHGQFDLVHVRPGAVSSEDTEGPGALIAPMPGKILDLNVANGDTVTRGQPLMVMEAMKMEQTLIAARDGIIEDLTVTTGDLVADGALLLTITETPD